MLLLINEFSANKAQEINSTEILSIDVDLLLVPIYAPAPFKRNFNIRRGNPKFSKLTKQRTILRKSRFQSTTFAPNLQSNTPTLQIVLPAETANNFKNLTIESTTHTHLNFNVLNTTTVSVTHFIKKNQTSLTFKKRFHSHILNEKQKTTEPKTKLMSSPPINEDEKLEFSFKKQEIYPDPSKSLITSSPVFVQKMPHLLPPPSANLTSYSSNSKKVVNSLATIVRPSTPIKILTVLDSNGNIQIRNGKVVIRRLIH